MADQKISELTNITGANLAEADEFVVVDASADQTKAITFGELKEAFDTGTGFVRITGDTMTGDLSFGDNDKATFGAGSDLQIYHSGTHSYIDDGGTGNLYVRATNFRINNAGNTHQMFSADDGGAVMLFNNGAQKLSTTSTGVNVSGTVTADGLIVSGGASSQIVLNESDTTNLNTRIINNTGKLSTQTWTDAGGLVGTRMLIDHSTGDISFYEDTGTTPKFFWDASAERLGIGTNLPTSTLDLRGTLRIDGGGNSYIYSDASGLNVETSGARFTRFLTNGSERMRIDSSGNVGIGTSSPSTDLDVFGGIRSTASGGYNQITTTSIGDAVFNNNGNNWLTVKNGVPADTMRIDGSGRVGIGTSTPDTTLHVDSGTVNNVAKFHSTDSTASIYLTDGTTTGGDTGVQGLIASGDSLEVRGLNKVILATGTTDRMTIDSSGNVLVGKTAANNTVVGVEAKANGNFSAVADNITPVLIRRKTSDGDLIELAKDGTTVGSIGTQYSTLNIDGGANQGGLHFSTGILPRYNGNYADNTIDMGSAAYRFDDFYATNGTIQTSDRNEKQDIDVLSDAEQRVAVACKGLLRKFRWIDSVSEKGDDARIHFGIIAQDLQDAFAAEGLDAGNYAMFISSTWWETQTDVPAVEAVEAVEATYDEDGNELTPAVEAVEAKEAYTRTDTYETLEEAPEGATERTRLGVRYPELLAFIIAAI